MARFLRRGAPFLVALGSVLSACGAEAPEDRPSSDLDISTIIGSPIPVGSLQWEVRGSGIQPRSGTFDGLSWPSFNQLRIEDIPVGTGYTIALSATAAGGTIVCQAQESFDIQSDSQSLVYVEVACEGDWEDPDEAAHRQLDHCGNDSGCPRSGFVQRADAFSGIFSMADVECLLAALRDRTPGLYEIELDWTWANGSHISTLSFAITPTGEIELGFRNVLRLAFEFRELLPTERCQPKSPAFYQACLDRVEDWKRIEDCLDRVRGPNRAEECLGRVEGWSRAELSEGVTNCVFPEDFESFPEVVARPPWFDNCVEQWPTCE